MIKATLSTDEISKLVEGIKPYEEKSHLDGSALFTGFRNVLEHKGLLKGLPYEELHSFVMVFVNAYIDDLAQEDSGIKSVRVRMAREDGVVILLTDNGDTRLRINHDLNLDVHTTNPLYEWGVKQCVIA